MLDWRGKGGKFLLRGRIGCCGSWCSPTGESDGPGSSRGSGRLGSGGEVEGRERGIGIVGVTEASSSQLLVCWSCVV
jgi:hypothetical protein